MATNKERIENLEAGLQRIEAGVAEKLKSLEDAISKLSHVVSSKSDLSVHMGSGNKESGYSTTDKEQDEATKDNRPSFISKTARLEFPKFSGDDPDERLTKAEQFFEYQGTTPTHKVALASFHMQEELGARFGPPECEDFDEALTRVKQTGSLREYQREFERLGNRVHGWTQKALVGAFMGGLKAEIADEVTKGSKAGAENIIEKQKGQPSFKKLSWEEIQRRKAQGICFHCDQKYTVGHDCKGKSQLLVLDGDFESENNAENDGLDMPQISLNTIMGCSSARTLRLKATVNNHAVIVLVDSGSTHNFIDARMAAKLQLTVMPTESFNVRVANGTTLQCHGRLDDVMVELQGTKFSLSLFSLPLIGLDMVLGVQWLQQLGSVVCDWRNLTMEFCWEGRR
ncbi:hypothetical protein AgCh_022091 [Apium graveolens]